MAVQYFRFVRRVAFGVPIALVAALMVLVVQAPPAYAASITVNTAFDIAPNAQGNFPTDGQCSLRAAIRAAQNNSNAHDVDCSTGAQPHGVLDVIQIAPSLAGHTLTLTYSVNGAVQPFDPIYGSENALMIIGPSTHAAEFTISGNGSVRPFLVGFLQLQPGVLTLANLTITGGNGANGMANAPAVQGQGGALYASNGSHVTLDNVVFQSNSASWRGGAVYAVESTITNNGGAYRYNSASDGGAIYLESGPSVVNGYAMLLHGNTASDKGGAVSANPGSSTASVDLERSLMRDNMATNGGGVMYIEPVGGPPAVAFELTDSTVVGNSSVFFSTATTQKFNFERSTFVNTGDVFNGTGGGTVRNSIIKGSTCTTNVDITNYQGTRNLIDAGAAGTKCDLLHMGSLGPVTGLSPNLAQNGGPEVQQTFALTSGSNAIDNGAAAFCGTVDARSVTRGLDGNGALNSPQVGDCDIGAYEYVGYIVNFQTGTSSVNEAAGTASIPVKLRILDPTVTSLPAPLTVPVSNHPSSTAAGGGVDVSVPGGGVTFPAGSVDGAVATLVVTVHQDNVAELFGELSLLDLGTPPAGVVVAEPKRHTLSIQDDDQAGVVVSETGPGTSIAEATPTVADSITVRLQSQPDRALLNPAAPGDPASYGPPASVDMTIRPDRDCIVRFGAQTATAASPIVVTIANADWQTGRTLEVLAVDDPWDEDLRDEAAPHVCEIRFTFDSADPIYDTTEDAFEVDVTDDDVAGVNVEPSGPPTVLAEGSQDVAVYTVSLDTPPDPGKPLPASPRGPTGVVLTPSTGCTVGAGPGVSVRRDFTGANYAVPQEVEVRPADNLVVELLHTCTVTTTIDSPDPVYANLDDPPAFPGTPPAIEADVQDYDPPGITDDPPFVIVSTAPDGLDVDEAAAGQPQMLSVVLERAPLGANVEVTVSVADDPTIAGPQLTVAPLTGVAGPTATLTFTPANWNVPRLVEVRAVDDDYDEDDLHQWSLGVSMTSTAPGFSSAALRRVVVDGTEFEGVAPVVVDITDDDTSAVVPSATPATVTEGGAGDVVSVQLATHPYADVDVTVTADDQCTVDGEPSITVSIAAGQWNVPIAIAVAAVQDAILEADHTCTLSYSATSSDAKYQGLTAQQSVAVVDDEVAEVIVTAGAVAVGEDGTTDTIDVVLGAKPSADVTVTFAHDGQTTSPGSVTFTTTDWDQTRTVTVAAVDDDVDEDDVHPGTIEVGVTTTAAGYATAPIFLVDGNQASTVAVDVTDDDVAGVTVAPTALTLVEGGADATYDVVLTSEPVADVTVSATTTGLCSASPVSLVFTASNWDTPQSVTVTPGDDGVVAPRSCAVAHGITTSDVRYAALTVASASGDLTEDDVAAVEITAGTLTVREDDPSATDTYEVVLGAQPLADVTVTVSPGAQVTATPSSLVFTPANWDTPQTVTVAPADDTDVEATPHVGVVDHTVASGDAAFAAAPIVVDGVTQSSVPVDIVDDETTTAVAVVGFPTTITSLRVRAMVTGGDATPTGSVQFAIDGTDVGGPVDLVDGVADADLGVLAVGSYTVTAAYTGDGAHEPSTGTVDVAVVPFVVPSPPAGGGGEASAVECDPATAPPFADVDPASVHAAAIACAAASGLVTGTTDGSFLPAGALSRAQAASLVRRLLDALDVEVVPGPDAFDDDDGSMHEDAIDAMAAAGVVTGTGPRTFDPDAMVSRGQLAALLDRVWTLAAGSPLPDGPNAFDDDDGSVHEAACDRLAAAGIAMGVAPRTFAPDVAVRRDQAASLVVRVLAGLRSTS